ncbi:MAG: hypothetical protein V4614_15105 [Pseudomonadota bacterium]
MEENEVITAESGTIALLNKGEIDMQIATAHKYPRSVVKFRNEVLQMVTLNEQIAGECVYALPRKEKDKETNQWVTKTIEGPSARFGEIVANAWGNNRAGARVVNDEGDFVTAQGVFHDLEKNAAITYEVQRRIVDSKGNRYKADMIGVTANAACSIALRNAILKGVPKAFWADMYDAARQCIMGDIKTLANRRSDAIAKFQRFGVLPAQIYERLDIAGIEDITLEHLVLLRGLMTAIREGDTTAEQAFAKDAAGAPAPAPRSKSEAAKTAATATPSAGAAAPAPTPPAETAASGEKGTTGDLLQTGAGQADKGSGELKSPTEAQVKHLKTKIAALELPDTTVQAMLLRLGATSIESMTFEQFDAARAEVLKFE